MLLNILILFDNQDNLRLIASGKYRGITNMGIPTPIPILVRIAPGIRKPVAIDKKV